MPSGIGRVMRGREGLTDEQVGRQPFRQGVQQAGTCAQIP
jgi:hypothetical protein